MTHRAPVMSSTRRTETLARHISINGLYKAELIYRRRPLCFFEAVALATLEWVDRFNNWRLLESIANILPAEAEKRDHAMLEEPAMAV